MSYLFPQDSWYFLTCYFCPVTIAQCNRIVSSLRAKVDAAIRSHKNNQFLALRDKKRRSKLRVTFVSSQKERPQLTLYFFFNFTYNSVHLWQLRYSYCCCCLSRSNELIIKQAELMVGSLEIQLFAPDRHSTWQTLGLRAFTSVIQSIHTYCINAGRYALKSPWVAPQKPRKSIVCLLWSARFLRVWILWWRSGCRSGSIGGD